MQDSEERRALCEFGGPPFYFFLQGIASSFGQILVKSDLRLARAWTCTMTGMRCEEKFITSCLSFRQNAATIGEKFAGQRLDWQKVLSIVTDQGVAAFLYGPLSSLKEFPVPGHVIQELRRISALTTFRNHLVGRTVHVLLRALRTADVPVLVLKGVALLHTVYKETPGMRDCVDIDLLVNEPNLSRAHQVLVGLGYTPENDPLRLDDDAYHLPMYLRQGDPIGVELHFGVARPDTPFRIEVADLHGRARPILTSGETMLVCSPEDMILHGILHLSFHKEFVLKPLRQLRDLGGIASKEPVDWDQVCGLARRYRAERSAYYALRLARVLLQAPIPEHVLSTLRSSIGAWELNLFAQVEEEGIYLSHDDPLRLFLQMLLLQIPAYKGPARVQFLFNVLRHPMRSSHSAYKLLPSQYRVSQFSPRHVLLVVHLCSKIIGIGLGLILRTIPRIATARPAQPTTQNRHDERGPSGPAKPRSEADGRRSTKG